MHGKGGGRVVNGIQWPKDDSHQKKKKGNLERTVGKTYPKATSLDDDMTDAVASSGGS